MTISEAEKKLTESLLVIYDAGESRAIAQMVMEKITGLRKMDRIISKTDRLNDSQQDLLTDYIVKLAEGQPVQYVLGEAWFASMKFNVNPNVLIPRPETEELVHWGIEFLRQQILSKQEDPIQDHTRIPIRILDIGTGSGCIAVSLKKALASADVTACDISSEALKVASFNAEVLDTPVSFMALDILDPVQVASLSVFDFIFSNPPYITLQESVGMPFNVLGFEPPLALFVPDNDPLLFYKAIAELANTKLSSDGTVFLEVHEAHAEEVALVFQSLLSMDVEIRKDMHGKSRMVKATRLP